MFGRLSVFPPTICMQGFRLMMRGCIGRFKDAIIFVVSPKFLKGQLIFRKRYICSCLSVLSFCFLCFLCLCFFRGMVSLTAGRNVGERRDPEETAEDKRQRKAQIKQDKKVRNALL